MGHVQIQDMDSSPSTLPVHELQIPTMMGGQRSIELQGEENFTEGRAERTVGCHPKPRPQHGTRPLVTTRHDRHQR